MARAAADRNIAAIIDAAIAGIVERTTKSIERALADLAATELKASRRAQRAAKAGRRGKGRRRRTARVEMTKWIADVRARRVPNFVIEMTDGLDTKKKIVAKFGENAAFEKGKPLPPVKADGAGKIATGVSAAPKAERVVKAKAPVRRKATAVK